MTIQAEGGAPMSQTLKPCPFCGNEDVLEHGDSDFWWIGCGQCHAEGPTGKLDDAIAAWNHRTDPQREALRSALEKLLSLCELAMSAPRYRSDEQKAALAEGYAALEVK